MARVRRNSHSGRKRHGSEQPEGQRHIRPKAAAHETQLPNLPHAISQATYPIGNTFAYRGIAPPPQLVTSPTKPIQQHFASVASPQSLGSPENLTAGFSTFDSSSYSPDRNRTLSPVEYTPTHSVASFERPSSHDGLSAFLSNRKRSDSGSTNFLEKTLNHGALEPLAGIDAICDGDPGDWSASRVHEPTPPSSMMLPSGLQHVRDLDEPWSPLEIEDGTTPGGSASPRPATQHSRISEAPTPPAARMPVRGGSRAGRRQGPLSTESRLNANDVRKERSCLRCFVYKETCDTSKDICQNCSNKQARTWKLGCVRPRLMFRTSYLLPEVLASRLERRYVDSFIQHKGWTCRDKPRFAIPLDIGLGPPLVVPVREFLPIGDLNRPAYLPIENGTASTAIPITMYDLPVVISCDKEEEAANHIRHSLLKWFQQTIDCTHESDWAWHWFNKGSDGFAGSVMKVICEYFQADIVKHRILKEALALSFFNYIFIYSFNVPDEHVPILQQRLETRIPPRAEYISPSIINLYIKMLMLPPLRDVVKRTLKGLELLLLDQQNGRTWRRDLIFCVSFIVIAYLGRTQVSVLQFAHQPAQDSSKVLTHQAATAQVLEMETEVADLVIKYHHQFLTPSPRRKASSATVTDAELAAEEHAQRFGLMDKVRKLKTDSIKQMPQSLEPQFDHVGDFIANNTTRLCWKFVEAILPEPESEQKQDKDTQMYM